MRTRDVGQRRLHLLDVWCLVIAGRYRLVAAMPPATIVLGLHELSTCLVDHDQRVVRRLLRDPVAEAFTVIGPLHFGQQAA